MPEDRKMPAGTTPDTDPLVGSLIEGRYQVIRRLGEGGMGAVYEVRHAHFGRHFALKTLKRELVSNVDLLARFQREPRLAAEVGNRHIVDVTDAGRLPDGLPFIVMELLRGESLAARIEREGRLEIDAAVDIAVQCCDALAAAHAKSIIHRDIKPDNVFLVAQDAPTRSAGAVAGPLVKILDFGIAKTTEGVGNSLTAVGFAVGTIPYMPPEQIRALPDIDGRADLYALGAVLFQMLAGRVPFEPDASGDGGLAGLQDLVQRILRQPPPSLLRLRAEVSPALESVIFRALEKERVQRFATAAEMATALEAALHGVASPSSRGSARSGDAPLADPFECAPTEVAAHRFGDIPEGTVRLEERPRPVPTPDATHDAGSRRGVTVPASDARRAGAVRRIATEPWQPPGVRGSAAPYRNPIGPVANTRPMETPPTPAAWESLHARRPVWGRSRVGLVVLGLGASAAAVCAAALAILSTEHVDTGRGRQDTGRLVAQVRQSERAAPGARGQVPDAGIASVHALGGRGACVVDCSRRRGPAHGD